MIATDVCKRIEKKRRRGKERVISCRVVIGVIVISSIASRCLTATHQRLDVSG